MSRYKFKRLFHFTIVILVIYCIMLSTNINKNLPNLSRFNQSYKINNTNDYIKWDGMCCFV